VLILVKERYITNRYSRFYLRFVGVRLSLVAAKRNLGQFFMLGDCWFFVHVSLLKFKKWAVPDGNVPPFDQIYHPFLDGFRIVPGLLSIYPNIYLPQSSQRFVRLVLNS
jgi:hypothetical protein